MWIYLLSLLQFHIVARTTITIYYNKTLTPNFLPHASPLWGKVNTWETFSLYIYMYPVNKKFFLFLSGFGIFWRAVLVVNKRNVTKKLKTHTIMENINLGQDVANKGDSNLCPYCGQISSPMASWMHCYGSLIKINPSVIFHLPIVFLQHFL